MELENASKKRLTISVRDFCILAAFYVLLFFQIFNGNKTAAGLRFVMLPSIIAGCLLICSIRFVSWKPHFNIPIIMSIFMVISTVCSDVVFWDINSTAFLLSVGMYLLATSQIYETNIVRSILRFYCGLVVLIGCWILLSYVLNINLEDNRASISFFGINKDQNYLSAYMTPAFAVITYSAFFGGRRKAWDIVKILILFVAIYLTGSRAALITMLISFALIMLKYVGHRGLSTRKMLVLFLIMVAVAIGAIWMQSTALFERMGDVDGYTTNIRLEIWEYAMEGFTRRPLLGSGFDAGSYYSQLKVRWFTHSCFVDILSGQGIIGAIFYICIFLGIFLKVNRENRLFVGMFILACFVPLAFINGYGTLTFWMPMTMCQVLSSTIRKYGLEKILP